MTRLHRNNAAERVMVIALTPVVWIVRLLRKARVRRTSREPSGSAAGKAGREKPRKSVMIEGLPPRTMN